ncbi:auxin-responsive protein SAUR50-like [Oryza brachyantha]|uniref:auxin-responsive protein SAUR50-like n=1 Tax=Oryza brachyantha TaxID=4533 RepID=UPI0007762BC2|nr:auxin-responsive protein SAUR50-like [Oryza brachyantha]
MAIKKGGAAGLKQILKRCSSLGRRQQQQQSGRWEEEEEEVEEETSGLPSDVPRGHFAVYVGERRRRFVVPIALLDRPEFRSLLRRAEEEFGFGGAGAGGLLVLPCEEVAFRSLTSSLQYS